MSSATPVIIIFVILIGGIVAWGALTEWTFSGLLPKEGAKCSPDEDDKDENATKYVYDEDEECTVIETCKTGWGPNTANTECLFSSVKAACTANTVYIANVEGYGFDSQGACSLAKSCKTGWKPSTSAKSCETGATCTANTVYIANATTFKTDSEGVCNLAKSCKAGWSSSTDDTSCIADEGEVCTANTVYIANAATFKTDSEGVCKLVKSCKTGWLSSTDDKSCIDEWTLPTKSKLSKYQALGYPVRKDDNKEPHYVNSEKTTIKDCREEAKSKNARMFGLRAIGNTRGTGPKTCWYYDKPMIVETVPVGKKISDIIEFLASPQDKYWVECADESKSAKDFCTK
tara:strand:+ start:183 stop:1217 length:1035 start_codon:yes stop_codon:yes gene_type:complete